MSCFIFCGLFNKSFSPFPKSSTLLSNTNTNHLDGCDRIIITSRNLRNLLHKVQSFDNLSKLKKEGQHFVRKKQKPNKTRIFFFPTQSTILFSSYFLSYLPKDRMSRFGGLVKPIQKGIVIDVDEELTSSRFGLSGIGHAQCSHSIGNSMLGLSDFIRNPTFGIARILTIVAAGKLGSGRGSSRTGTRTVGILGIRTTKLIHKAGNHAMEML